jgi:hypothetical protein
MTKNPGYWCRFETAPVRKPAIGAHVQFTLPGFESQFAAKSAVSGVESDTWDDGGPFLL